MDDAAAAGISIFKVGMTWPLETRRISEWTDGLDHVLVVEEKRALIETQLKEALYNKAAAGLMSERPPTITGKLDLTGTVQFAETGDILPETIATVLQRLLSPGRLTADSAAVADEKHLPALEDSVKLRSPYFCAGCPHNSSTKVPQGSRAIAAIGCSYMAMWMDRDTFTSVHMGGEGMTWVGQEPFSKTKHIFQNMGDGTYMHDPRSSFMPLDYATNPG
jgi:indolepyruvate ferredoxin oxidoreductase